MDDTPKQLAPQGDNYRTTRLRVDVLARVDALARELLRGAPRGAKLTRSDAIAAALDRAGVPQADELLPDEPSDESEEG